MHVMIWTIRMDYGDTSMDHGSECARDVMDYTYGLRGDKYG